MAKTQTSGFKNRRGFGRLANLARAVMIALAATIVATGAASAETRTLKLYYIHTKEKKAITYKKNGKYLSSGLKEINRFLRDWRRNEPTKMDPQLLDIVWEAYQKTGSREYIHVVSAYRSPKTNAMLRRTRGGQAKKSQHMLGKALDFYIPGVKIGKLREIGFKLQGGGVGYYPKSGVPFVHLDTGNVRAWPRMSRSELARVFPRGGTLHLPTDGKPLPGYDQAMAEYKKRKARGQATATVGGGGSTTDSGGRPKTLLAAIFGGGADEEEDNAEETVAVAAAPARSQASETRAAASAPVERPDTPATLLAALPSNRMPVPDLSPRTNRGGVPVAIAPEAPVQVARTEPAAPPPDLAVRTEPATPVPPIEIAAAPAPETSIPAYAPPLPGARPSVLVAAAQPAPADRRTAAELESALAAANSQANQPVATAEAAQPTDTAQRDAILAALQARPEPVAAEPQAPVELAYALPIPSETPSRPAAPAAAAADEIDPAEVPLPETVVAYAPPTPAASTVAPLTRAEIAAINELANTQPSASDERPKASRLPVPAARETQALEADETLTASLDTGVRTTAKAARPTQTDVIAETATPAAVPVAAANIEPARFGSWTTASASLTDEGRADARPDFVKNALREAPEVVYTSGFERKALPKDTNSFSGTAVTFLAVAKFEGSEASGDGQPLQLQLPLTN